MASESHTTKDHDEIRSWVEEHGGKPVIVKGTEGDGDGAGVLRIDFPGGAGEEYFDPISWDEWFESFDSLGLSFLYQAHKADGSDSTFFKLIRDDD